MSPPPSVTITQLEPVVFLRGQSATGEDARGRRRPINVDAPPSQLRGLVTLHLPKPSKIKEICISLTGTARTDWPEGIGPNRLELVEEVTIFKQVISLYNAKQEGSQPARRRSNSVGPGIGLHDDVEWDLAQNPNSFPNPATTSNPSSPQRSRDYALTASTHTGTNLARQIAGAAARAETAIIPPTLRPELGLAKTKDSQNSNRARPTFNRTGSGTTSWIHRNSCLSNSPPTSRAPTAVSTASELQRAAHANSSRTSQLFAAAQESSNDSLHTRRGWSQFLGQASSGSVDPPVYTAQSAPLYGYTEWPGQAATSQHDDSNSAEALPTASSAVENSTSDATAPNTPSSQRIVTNPNMNADSAQSSSAHPSSPGPSRGILYHQTPSSNRTKDHAVRFDATPSVIGTSPTSSSLGERTSRSTSPSAPPSCRNSAEIQERERANPHPKPKPSFKSPTDGKAKKTGLKGLIGGLLKEPDAKAEDESGTPSEWKEFKKGTYTYPICISLPANLPPTLHADFGYNRYVLRAFVNRAGALTPNLFSEREVKLIHAADEDALDETGSIVVERCWEDVLSYMVVLSGKSFPIGQKIPLWMKFVPIGKIKIHRIQATLEEKTDYYAKGRRVARHEVPRRWNLLKITNKDSGKPLLPILSDSSEALSQSPLAPLVQQAAGNELDSDMMASVLDPFGPWELATNLAIPETSSTKIHLSTNHAKSNIAVHHLIRIAIRVEKPDGTADLDMGIGSSQTGAKAHKLFDIIIEAPITLTSTHTAEEWVSLPNYWSLAAEPEEPSEHAATNHGANQASDSNDANATVFSSLPSSSSLPSPSPSPARNSQPGTTTNGASAPVRGGGSHGTGGVAVSRVQGTRSPIPLSSPSLSPRQGLLPREHDSVAAGSTPAQLSQRWLALSSNVEEPAVGLGVAGGSRSGNAGSGPRSYGFPWNLASSETPPPAYQPNAARGERTVATSPSLPTPSSLSIGEGETHHPSQSIRGRLHSTLAVAH